MSKKWVSIFCLIFMMVTTVVWAKPDSAYIDNGNGTVTDIETKLMWQQATAANKMDWNYADSHYCRSRSLAGYTDWRLPTLVELKTLVDKSWGNYPTINRTFFPGTVSSFYWSSTTRAANTDDAWGVNFYYGNDSVHNKLYSYYVRAVRGGQAGSLDYLVISPLSQTVTTNADSTTFSVSNTGVGIIPWKAAVTAGAEWLSISSGAGGTDTGTITCAYTAYIGTALRTGTIQVTAYGATSSLIDVTVTQAVNTTACTAAIDSNNSLHIPLISHLNPQSNTLSSYSADFAYKNDPAFPTMIFFKLTNHAIQSETFTCTASTLSNDSTMIHIPDFLMSDGSRMWLDMTYSESRSTNGDVYFYVSKYGVIK
jgi:Protein of unknown function (DUF1566)/Viral BACON domain